MSCADDALFFLPASYQGSLYSKCGSCPHELLTRWLEADGFVSLATTDMFTEKHAPGNIDEADARLRTDKGAGRPVAMPKKSAWSTMEAIRSKVAKKAADRKRKADERKELAWELFRKGLKPDATEAPLLEGQARHVPWWLWSPN